MRAAMSSMSGFLSKYESSIPKTFMCRKKMSSAIGLSRETVNQLRTVFLLQRSSRHRKSATTCSLPSSLVRASARMHSNGYSPSGISAVAAFASLRAAFQSISPMSVVLFLDRGLEDFDHPVLDDRARVAGLGSGDLDEVPEVLTHA